MLKVRNFSFVASIKSWEVLPLIAVHVTVVLFCHHLE